MTDEPSPIRLNFDRSTMDWTKVAGLAHFATLKK